MIYKICFDESILDLEEEVNDYLTDGYNLYGVPFMKGKYLCQVVKKDN